MACGSCGGGVSGNGPAAPYVRGNGGATLYQVVLKGGAGAVTFQTHDVELARRVQDGYKGSVLRPDPDAGLADEVPDPEPSETPAEAEPVKALRRKA